MSGNLNLVQFDEMPPEVHRELSRRGGVASGETRRRKASLRAHLVEMLERSYLVDEVMTEFDRALAIVKQKEKHRQQDARRKRTRREKTEGEQ